MKKMPPKKAAKKAAPKATGKPSSFEEFREKLMAKKGKGKMAPAKKADPRAAAMARVRALSKR